ncbi:MAG: nucleotidyltransferase family protein [Actinomycetota bacterium]|nr:nucleotidyltransferase family protein [Actinomycetota bacterium]
MASLTDKLAALLKLLENAGIEAIVGGGLALMFHVGEPRTTNDIDLQVYPTDGGIDALVRVLGTVVEVGPQAIDQLHRIDQARLTWGLTPIDLFLPAAPFHFELRRRAVQVDFPGVDRPVPILSATDLTIFKALFNRTKDWADIEDMVRAGTPDLATAERTVREFGQREVADRLSALR